jgi:hypothetical protein
LHVDADLLAELPEFNRFLGRLSVAMSQGDPAADLAWLRADPSHPDRAHLQLGRITPGAGESATTGALRARGLVHDRVSRRMLAGAQLTRGACTVGARQYRAILLDSLEIAEPELVERIVAIAEAGIPVLALGRLPRRAPGLRDADARDRRVGAASERLSELVVRVPGPERLEALLAKHVMGSLVEPPPGAGLSVSLERRRSRGGDILLVFNESWSPRRARLRFTRSGGPLTSWDPRSGTRTRLRDRVTGGDVVPVELGPAETLILTLGPAEESAARPLAREGRSSLPRAREGDS